MRAVRTLIKIMLLVLTKKVVMTCYTEIVPTEQGSDLTSKRHFLNIKTDRISMLSTSIELLEGLSYT